MTVLKPGLEAAVKEIFRATWSRRDGQVVPEPQNLQLGNDAVDLDATVLYADIASSTALVDSYKDWFAAEVYKTFLSCAAKIIKDEDGVVTAYDGDRVMAVYRGELKNSRAVRTALRIHSAVMQVVQPCMDVRYESNSFRLKHVVGIDTSKLMVSRIGVRNDNDLVWVGRAANYAAKLCTLNEGFTTYITHSVYDNLANFVKCGLAGENMWKPYTWTPMNKLSIYASNHFWTEL